MRKLLLIAGMGQSVGLARDLCALGCFHVICVTEGRAVARAEPPAEVCEDSFEQDADFRAFLAHHQFDWVVDAAHPFATRLGALAQQHQTDRKQGKYLRITRAPWRPKVGESWQEFATLAEAIGQIPAQARVFIATGRGSLAAFEGRDDLHVLCRQLRLHDQTFPLAQGGFVFGEGPFSIQDEIALFQKLDVGYLLLRNSGSLAGRSKVDAACACGVQVLMIAPHAPLRGCVSATFEQAIQQMEAMDAAD